MFIYAAVQIVFHERADTVSYTHLDVYKRQILYGADEQRLFSAAMTIEKYCEVKTPDCY